MSIVPFESLIMALGFELLPSIPIKLVLSRSIKLVLVELCQIEAFLGILGDLVALAERLTCDAFTGFDWIMILGLNKGELRNAKAPVEIVGSESIFILSIIRGFL